ncbi:hypothetical protein N7468_000259 [Penicillium chermesinum]|uniref:Secreted protein n=1 Tax=Penicillium chermesinum TaxID=63820 RepID=A0A9W9TY69_9EURO|nr:uncharacterized protein N7468_000259 [Penicillium chermesinum]KAJ5248808.1 hypothetical protein N7468_000259 [Penicillium chermesinum]
MLLLLRLFISQPLVLSALQYYPRYGCGNLLLCADLPRLCPIRSTPEAWRLGGPSAYPLVPAYHIGPASLGSLRACLA